MELFEAILAGLKLVTVVLGAVFLFYTWRAYRKYGSPQLLILFVAVLLLTAAAVAEGLMVQVLKSPLDEAHVAEAVLTLAGFGVLVYSLVYRAMRTRTPQSFEGAHPTSDVGGAGADTGTTILDAIRRFDRAGYTGQYRVLDDATIECLVCHTKHAPEELALEDVARVEGTSDPDDEGVVAALRCPNCESKGTLVFVYGAAAPAAEGEALRRLHDARPGHS